MRARKLRLRWAVALLTLTAGAVHVPVIPSHLDEAPYMGALFIVLTAACTVLAIGLVLCDAVPVYALTMLTCGLAAIGYLATRLIPFPMLADDVGNWLDPLGIVAMLTETAAMVIAAEELRRGRSRRGGPTGYDAADRCHRCTPWLDAADTQRRRLHRPGACADRGRPARPALNRARRPSNGESRPEVAGHPGLTTD